MANIKSIGGNPIVLGLDGLTDDAKAALGDSKLSAAAESLLGADSTAQWAQRESAGSGAATVRSVQGAAVAWNQLIQLISRVSPPFGVTITTDPATGLVSLSGTTTSSGGRNNYIATNIPWVAGHKYLILDTINYSSGNTTKWVVSDTTTASFVAELLGGNIYTATTDHVCWIGKNFASAGEVYDCSGYVSLYDLTQMFGAGNEPSTVAEFEAMYPAAYYPYSAPTLKPVRIAGIASTDAQGNALDSVEWTTQTLRAVGSVADMLYSDHVDVRVGVVDLGTLDWEWFSNLSVFLTNKLTDRLLGASTAGICATYGDALAKSSSAQIAAAPDKTLMLSTSNVNIFVKDSTYGTDAAAFKAAMNGVLLFYTLATPTTTQITPPLHMTYRVQQGGSESVIVPAGEVSAAPVLTIAEGESAAELVMDALACIATPDSPVATANHAVGTYLTMQGKLYKVTSAIAVGETIVAGTNVTATTVMDEILALN